jgi:hypothetical protein
LLDCPPGRDRGGVEAEGFKAAQSVAGKAIAAGLVPWETGLVDHGYVVTGPGEVDGGGGAGRASAHDNDVCPEHPSSVGRL